MERHNEHIDDLLGKFLSGEATQAEQAVVSRWLSESETNQKYFDQLQKIFEGASSIREWQHFNTDAAWENVRSKLHGKARVVPMETTKLSWQWLKVAAAILVFLSVGIYLYTSSEDPITTVQVVAGKQAVSDTLPDGSDVFLNRQTTLAYAFNKKTKVHDVKLNGEAYFNVKTGGDEEFIISAGEVFIKDIGTSFNVKAYPDSDVIEVLVEEGEIVFYTAENPGIHLKGSGRGVYNKKTKKFTIDEPEPNITAYKTKFFVFSETTLEEVAAQLNHVYNVPVMIDENLKACRITVSFRNEPVDEIAAIIAETLNLNVTQDASGIRLNGPGCE